MKKNTKIVSLLSLSAAALVALASCGGNSGRGGTDVPGFHIYAVSEDYNLTNDTCITATAVGDVAYNQDLKVSIKPNRYFSLKYGAEDNPQLVIPYVGYGNEINKFSHELIKDMAWTYEDKSTDTGEEYILTVKKDYFVKNIVISYGDDGKDVPQLMPVQCMQSNYYYEQTKDGQKVPLAPANLKYTTLTGETPNVNDVFKFSSDKSKCIFANDDASFVFELKNNSKSDLINWAAYETTINANPTNRKFSNIQVLGVHKDDPTITDDLTEIVDGKAKVKVEPDAENGLITVNIPWSEIVEKQFGSKYGSVNKYGELRFNFDPLYRINVKTTNNSPSDISNLRAGYVADNAVKGLYERFDAMIWDHTTFRQNAQIRFDCANPEAFAAHVDTLARDNGRGYKAQVQPGFEESAVDQTALSDKDEYNVSLYSANFIYNQNPQATSFVWPKAEIKVSSPVSGTKTVEWDPIVHKTDWRNAYYRAQSQGSINEELEYMQTKDGAWRLVLINKPGRVVGTKSYADKFGETVTTDAEDYRDKNNAYVLYNLGGVESLGNGVEITLSK